MKKKLINTLLCSSIIATPIIGTIGTVTSCSLQSRIDSIELYPEIDFIRPGETRVIRAVAVPTYERIVDLDWKLVDCPLSGVTINYRGQITISNALKITDPIVVNIQATLLGKTEISNTTHITILPKAIGDFQGFKNNEIQFLNRSHEITSVQIKKIDDNTYETAHNVDLMQADVPVLPEGWTSLINFEALVGGDMPNFMSFTLDGGDYVTHAIQWSEDYDDSSWTSIIPSFWTINDTNIFDSITVRFSCDTNVTLKINFTAWQNPELQTSTGVFSYIPGREGDTYNPIEYVEEGIYKLLIPVPAMSRQGIITQNLDSIYAFRQKFEYTDIYFDFEMSPSLDDDIKNMFVYVHNTEAVLVERPFDGYRAFKFQLSYQIDLSLREYTYEHWDYSDVQIGTIYAMDVIPEFGDAANLEIWITWVE